MVVHDDRISIIGNYFKHKSSSTEHWLRLATLDSDNWDGGEPREDGWSVQSPQQEVTLGCQVQDIQHMWRTQKQY